MNNENKSLMSPDRVLSLVVLVLAVFMIIINSYLYYAQASISRAGAIIGIISNQTVGQIQVDRQQVQGADEEDTGSEVTVEE